MITRFYIDNFKSLVKFDLQLSKFTCLIGLNGAGKSTVLQAMDFVSAIMAGEVEEWLEKRNWDIKSLNSDLTSRFNMEIIVEMEMHSKHYRWRAVFNRTKQQCTSERLECTDNNLVLFSMDDGQYRLYKSMKQPSPIPFQYTGSLLSQLKPELLGKETHDFHYHLVALRSLDLLSPHLLRQKSRTRNKVDIGGGGEQLSSFIHQLNANQHDELVRQLRLYYPQIIEIKTSALRSGWIQLEVIEEYSSTRYGVQEIKVEAKHINDGMLRLLAILAQQFSLLETLLFDEIENGINSEVIEKVVDALIASPKQIIVTTHNSMFLNYMSDDVAKQSVMLIYKTKAGVTQATRFFSVPSVARKLASLAPGDAMLDVFLAKVATEAEPSYVE